MQDAAPEDPDTLPVHVEERHRRQFVAHDFADRSGLGMRTEIQVRMSEAGPRTRDFIDLLCVGIDRVLPARHGGARHFGFLN